MDAAAEQLVDVADLDLDELAAVVGVCGVRATAKATGLPMLTLMSAAGLGGSAPVTPAVSSMHCAGGCGALLSDYRYRGGVCQACRSDYAAERRERARVVLASGLRGFEAQNALMEAEGVTRRTAEHLLCAVRAEQRLDVRRRGGLT